MCKSINKRHDTLVWRNLFTCFHAIILWDGSTWWHTFLIWMTKWSVLQLLYIYSHTSIIMCSALLHWPIIWICPLFTAFFDIISEKKSQVFSCERNSWNFQSEAVDFVYGFLSMLPNIYRYCLVYFSCDDYLYSTSYPDAISLLTTLLQASHTNALLATTQQSLHHTLPLGSYLLKPVQRILKYHLLLDVSRRQHNIQCLRLICFFPLLYFVSMQRKFIAKL